MKQYTNESQTAKLVELGFAPKMRIKDVCTNYGTVNIEHETYFDVGGLIEMLPMTITHEIWFGEDKGKEGVWGLRIDTGGRSTAGIYGMRDLIRHTCISEVEAS